MRPYYPSQLGLLIGTFAVCLVIRAHAAQGDVSGNWTTTDDVTGKPRSVVEIIIADGLAQGTITKLFPRPGDTGICHECTGDLKDKPVVGMHILRDVRRDGDQWDGGTILDPGNGSSYDVRLRLIEGGSKLEVRGFKGSRCWAARRPGCARTDMMTAVGRVLRL